MKQQARKHKSYEISCQHDMASNVTRTDIRALLGLFVPSLVLNGCWLNRLHSVKKRFGHAR
jgi:hypothetical protein